MYIGVDIGLNGAICAFKELNDFTLYDMPIYKYHGSNDINIKDYFKILDKHKDDVKYIIIEDIKSIFGVSKRTMLSMGKQIGYIQAYCNINNIPLLIVKPKQWQTINKNIPQVDHPNIVGKYKDTFYESINTLFYLLGVEKVNSIFLNKKRYHDGKIDAFLIAYYIYKEYAK